MDDQTSIETIAASTPLLAEVRRHLPAMHAKVTAPATVEEIEQIIGSRFVVFPQPNRETEEWSAWWKAYGDALAGIPAASIEVALAGWMKRPDAEFLPKPGALRQLALTAVSPRSRAYAIAKAADELEARRREQRGSLEPNFALTHPRSAKTEESREAVAAMADHVLAKLRMPREKLPPLSRQREGSAGSAVYRQGMEDGLANARQAAPTEMQRIAATLDENSQGRLEPGRAVTARLREQIRETQARDGRWSPEVMVAVTADRRMQTVREHGGAPVPPGGHDFHPAGPPALRQAMDDWS